MEIDSLKRISIIHPKKKIKEYRWLSGYFRLAGIFVYEQAPDEEVPEKTDFVIRVKEDATGDGTWESLECKINSKDTWEKIEPEDKETAYTEENWVSAVLRKMQALFLFSQISILTFSHLADCYVKKRLMSASYALEYFGDSGQMDIYEYMAESGKKFLDTCNQLKRLENIKTESVYLLSAICNCQRRVDEIYTVIWNAMKNEKMDLDRQGLLNILRNMPYQPFEEINERIQKIISLDASFFGAYAIRGFVKLVDDRHRLEAGYDFEKAVKLIGKNQYASCLLYRLGKFMEGSWGDKNIAEHFYKKACTVKPSNFRAVYKIAYRAQKNRNYEEALICWYKILSMLADKKDSSYLQPVECAYLYKTNNNIGDIYMNQGEYQSAIGYFLEAEKIWKSQKNLEFYNWMFGTERGYIFKKAASDKLQVRKCRQKLADAYAMANRMDKAIEYNVYY